MNSDPTEMNKFSPRQVLPYNGEAWLYEHFYSPDMATEYFNLLRDKIEWRQDAMKMYGKELLLPRLTASYGEMYVYSGIRHPPSPMPVYIQEMMNAVQEATSHHFNSVLLNFYRDGNDSMGWHSDSEKSLGTNPAVASVSLGQPRPFQFRHRNGGKPITVLLEHGSLLLMAGESQHHWTHQLPKRKGAIGPRINITFRKVVE
jgi:alkylated DNA repair dioxygenase AlkB